MTPLRANVLPVLSLDDGEGPMYRQLYDWFRRSIAGGQLRPGQRVLVRAIKAQMEQTLEVIGADAGMHLVALLPRGVDDVAIARKAARRGISAMPLSSCYVKPHARKGLILGYGGTNAQQINEAMRELKKVVRAERLIPSKSLDIR